MTKDMTSGAITPLLIKFTIPLVLGNLFQLTYNAADSIIVGKFVGEDALAAVGTSNPLMTLAILFINGMCLGAGILVSTAFGAGDTRLVERQVSTAVCLLFAQPIIRLFATDPAVVNLGVRFLRTSALFYMLPAATNGILGFFRGMGDLKVTLNSSMLNMGGRVAAAALFVLVMKMDIEALPFSYAVGWLLMLLHELPMLVRFLRSSEM